MSDERPRPQYGEYAPVPPKVEYPPPTLPEPSESPERPKYNTRDLIITTALLLFGVWDVASRWQEYLALGPLLSQAYATQNLGEFTSFELAATVGLWINVTRAIILTVTIVVSLLLISRGRRAFWVPLAGGVLAFLVLVALSAYVVLSDPAFTAFVERSTLGS